MKSYMDAGELVPDEIVVAIMTEAISAPPAEKGLILAGFPRTVPQAEALDAQLSALARPLDAVLVIDAPDELVVERIAGRRSCSQCGRVYHSKYLLPVRAGHCDTCGAELIQRPDDVEAVVRERLDAYHRQTAPVIEYYRSRRPIIGVDGSAGPDEVTRLVTEALAARGAAWQGKHGRGD